MGYQLPILGGPVEHLDDGPTAASRLIKNEIQKQYTAFFNGNHNSCGRIKLETKLFTGIRSNNEFFRIGLSLLH